MRIAAVVEARMSSTRLPGKVLLPLSGKPLLRHVVDRLAQVKSLNTTVLATTMNPADVTLIEFARDADIDSFRGSEEDVMARVIGAAESVHADVIVSVTGDCPLIDPLVVEQLIQMYLHNPCDYASNRQIPTYPGGTDTQVYPLAALKRSAAMTDDPLDREHVTLHIRNHPELFRHLYLIAPADQHWPELDLSVDEESDYLFVKTLLDHFGDTNPYFGCREIVEVLRLHPEWVQINANVQRKGDS